MISITEEENSTRLENWWVITLLKVDYKILANVLRTWLSTLTLYTLHSMQTSGGLGWHVECSLHTFWVLLAAQVQGEWAGYIIKVDQTKAFYWVQHTFLWWLLKIKGIPKALVDALRTLYCAATTMSQVQGHDGCQIGLTGGIQQGCLLSPILYVCTLDPLLCRLNADPTTHSHPDQATGSQDRRHQKRDQEKHCPYPHGRSLHGHQGLEGRAEAGVQPL